MRTDKLDRALEREPFVAPVLLVAASDIDPLEIRGQFDATWNQDVVSAVTGIAFDPRDSVTRQEFAAEADVNVILSRAGAFPDMRPLSYGEHDFDMTLQSGLEAQRQASVAWARLPAAVRKRYLSWPGVIRAMQSGELKYEEPAPLPPVVPPVADKPAEPAK